MTLMLDLSHAAASDVPRIAGIDPEQLPLPAKFDYHLMLTRSPIGCHQPLVLVLRSEGSWGLHRQHSDSSPECIETYCGEGACRFLVSLDRVPYFDEEVLCEYCWPAAEMEKVVNFLTDVEKFSGEHGTLA
jgi:hypothetical protein